MKALYLLSAVPMLALVAAAQPQDDVAQQKMKSDLQKMKAEMESMVAQSKVIGVRGTVMGATVKGAPYSAVEVTESNQTLGDGTRIHNESQTQVYRDNEGRVRRETPDQVTIMDPVAGATWFLDPKTQTARKAPLGMMGAKTFMFDTRAGVTTSGETSSSYVETRTVNKDGVTTVTVNGKQVDPATADQMKMAQLKMAPGGMEPMVAGNVAIARPLPPGSVIGPDTFFLKTDSRWSPAEAESLGKQSIEGVTSDGTRSTTTVPAGAIGNDRPIQSVMERWYSPELQTVTMTRHSDPRTGEETFKLTSINRNEPPAYLFSVPSNYQIQEHK